MDDVIECPEDILVPLNLFQALWPNSHPNPFANVGATYNGNRFSAHSYYWNWEEDIDGPEPPNFKWRDLEIEWYKYLGRCTYANRTLSRQELLEMLNECLKEILEIPE